MLAQKTKTIPIVFAISQDPVGSGLVVSLRRPGGNVTGLTNLVSELGRKRLQLLKEAFPRVTHIVLLFEPDNLGSVSQAKEIGLAASHLSLRVTQIELRQPEDIELAFKRGGALGAQAYMVTQGGFINSQRRAITDRIIRLKVPASYTDAQYVEAGGLMSYAASPLGNFRQAADYVDKIFKGSNPGDLPIEQPVKFELVLNLKTARAMGIKFPQSIIVQANRIIE
jgi:putative ABC transport system substrate-binding protein